MTALEYDRRNIWHPCASLNGPPVMLGYNYRAPFDVGGAPASIVSAWLAGRAAKGDVAAWMDANDIRRGKNACAIVKGVKYVYFHKITSGFYRKKEVLKDDW